jgi:hypothetical protein
MKFKEGDKVQLINEAVKATVSKLYSDTEVYVLDENGFEYRVKVSDIVPALQESEEDIDEAEADDSNESSLNSIINYFSGLTSCFFCIVPEDSANLLQPYYSIILVNASDDVLLYSLHFPDGSDDFSTYGIVEQQNEYVAYSTTHGDVFRGLKYSLRYIIHSAKDKVGLREFAFTPEDFLDEKLFLTPDLFRNRILAFDINAPQEVEIPEREIQKLSDYFSPEKRTLQKPFVPAKTKIDESVLLTNEKTIDLHIEELTDEYPVMNSAEMLNLQLEHFRKELDSAMLYHYYRVIFIHGKGNGTLKNKMRSELDSMNLKYKDADTARFGYGATEVLL